MNDVVLIIDVDTVGAAGPSDTITVLKIVDNEETVVFIATIKPL